MATRFQQNRAGCSHFGVPISSGLLAEFGCELEPTLFAVLGGRPACRGFAATSGVPFIGISGPTNWGYGCTPRGPAYFYKYPSVDSRACHYAIVVDNYHYISTYMEDPLRKYTSQGDLVTSTEIDDLHENKEAPFASCWCHATNHLYLVTTYALRMYDSDLNRLWTLWWFEDTEYHAMSRMTIDAAGQIYLANGRKQGESSSYNRLIKIDQTSRTVLWDTLFNNEGNAGVADCLSCSLDGYLYAGRRRGVVDEEKSIYRYTQAGGSASGSVRAITHGHGVVSLCCTPGGYVIAGIREYDPEDEWGGVAHIKKFSSGLGGIWIYTPDTACVAIGAVACDDHDHVYASATLNWYSVPTDVLFALTADGDLRWASPPWTTNDGCYSGLHYWPVTWLG